MSNETKPGVVALHILCAVCGERYGNHYGPFCDHSDKERLFGDRVFIPATHEATQQDTNDERDLFESFWTCNLLSFGEIGSREFTIAWAAWQARAALAANQKEGKA